MDKICQKAKDRIDKLEERDRYLESCYKYLVCPKCGEDVKKIDVSSTRESLTTYMYRYICTSCTWGDHRST